MSSFSHCEDKWIWHPQWSETDRDTAGGFTHFRKLVVVPEDLTGPVRIQITADTRYKLFINGQLVSFGPVKGDQHRWFYDEVDIAPFLRPGRNRIAVRVLRFYYATSFATSFPRLQSPGLLVRHVKEEIEPGISIQTDDTWETSLDLSSRLPVDIKEDDFLHIYEDVDNQKGADLHWVPARVLDFPRSHGLTAPWKLSPRMIPPPKLTRGRFKALRNVVSLAPLQDLERLILMSETTHSEGVLFKAGSTHHIEIEAEHHITALLAFRFRQPLSKGSVLRITYSDCYEDEPLSVPYLRKKGDRQDSSKRLLGPQDIYRFGGNSTAKTVEDLWYGADVSDEENFVPFHFRTLRFMALDIQVAEDSDLLLKGIDMTLDNYPLDVRASLDIKETSESLGMYSKIWSTSLRTLSNCLHDCYEDCPFYEQMQYAMDTRSSILFTYAISHDDRLARQAIIQLHNSYMPSLGLTASRAPTHQVQVIPHFSLYWICMVQDHFEYFGAVDFIRQFNHTCDGVLESFSRWVDPELGLVRHDSDSPHWFFVDWTDSWRPMGIPPAGARTGYLSYTSMLYAYALRAAAKLARGTGRPGLGKEYDARADALTEAVKTHCFDGQFFTDGLAAKANPAEDYSQHTQLWAVLSGAATDTLATSILEASLRSSAVKGINVSSPTQGSNYSILFSPTSTAMSFYTLCALSTASFDLYNAHFHAFWTPWRHQLACNLTTWEEDSVSQRSDCHAWGCAALYEFSAEVAGITPGGPGWETIRFRPRVGLFREFKARVPFGGGRRCAKGVASVEWRPVDDVQDRVIRVSLRLDLDDLGQEALGFGRPSVEIVWPDGKTEVADGKEAVERVVVLP